ncbi:MAG TPA: hypothetical protein VLH59_15725 [Ignavibacteriaceae bacterium]|nr:hypothetical protein [Ignavibacteriaceae bacterium]
MKTLFVAVVALFFAFFLGCQSSITDPVELESTKFLGYTDEETSAYKDVASLYPGIINVQATILDESVPSNTVDVIGTVRYKLESVDADESIHSTIVKVKLFVNADLTSSDPGQAPWVLYSTDEDVVTVLSKDHANIILEKKYEIINVQMTPIEVVLTFNISDNSMSLAIIDYKKIWNITPNTKVF